MSIFAGKAAKRSRSVFRCCAARIGRRREERDLFAVHHRLERRAHRHFGLAVADVAAQQPIHRRRRFHVALDVGDRCRLIGRQRELERVLEFFLPVRVGAERVTGHGLARRIELEQLLGHVAHGLLDLGLGALPGGAAEPIERRLRAAGVFLDQVETLDRHEQLRVAEIAKLEELLHDVAAGDGDLLEADELADAVIDVNDQIADLEVAQVGEECGRHRSLLAGAGLAPLFVEDVGLGVDLKGLGLGTWGLGLFVRKAQPKPFDSHPSATITAPATTSPASDAMMARTS